MVWVLNIRRLHMSRAGEEMVLELATLLNNGVVKTAAKKDEEEKEGKKHEEKESKEFEKGEEEEEKEADKGKDKKKGKKDKKDEKKEASIMVRVLQDLVKLASELDELGADAASELVDSALKVIVANLEKKK